MGPQHSCAALTAQWVQVVTCLLQPSPNRRPSVARLLESSVVQRHLATDAPPESAHKREVSLLKTIRVRRPTRLQAVMQAAASQYSGAAASTATKAGRLVCCVRTRMQHTRLPQG